MQISQFNRRLKPWMLPIAMVCGVFFHDALNHAQWAVPYLIFTMLLITFCRVRPSDLRIDGMIWRLLLVQLVGTVTVFVVLRPVDLSLAQSVMICVLCPTATAAPVVTGMLGGSIGKVASYSIVSNIMAALLAPAMFVWCGSGSEISFFEEFMLISMKVAPMIVFPLGLAMMLYFTAPKIHAFVADAQKITFYLWSVSLLLVVGKSVSFVLAEPKGAIPLMVAIAFGAGVVCLLQFYIGRRIGLRYNHPISCAQGLGQKNTVLAVWMAVNYLNPISSIGPAAYIAWQNSINSLQIYLKMKREGRTNEG
ncbi:MAG: transporter [Muribaculaceae bacterium]|nr:transporter [Muribaculaceae bacterium]